MRQRTWFEQRGIVTVWWPVKGLRLAMRAWPTLAKFVAEEGEGEGEGVPGQRGRWLRDVEHAELDRAKLEHGEGERARVVSFRLRSLSPARNFAAVHHTVLTEMRFAWGGMQGQRRGCG